MISPCRSLARHQELYGLSFTPIKHDMCDFHPYPKFKKHLGRGQLSSKKESEGMYENWPWDKSPSFFCENLSKLVQRQRVCLDHCQLCGIYFVSMLAQPASRWGRGGRNATSTYNSIAQKTGRYCPPNLGNPSFANAAHPDERELFNAIMGRPSMTEWRCALPISVKNKNTRQSSSRVQF